GRGRGTLYVPSSPARAFAVTRPGKSYNDVTRAGGAADARAAAPTAHGRASSHPSRVLRDPSSLAEVSAHGPASRRSRRRRATGVTFRWAWSPPFSAPLLMSHSITLLTGAWYPQAS